MPREYLLTLPALPDTAEEIKTAAHLLSSKNNLILLGADATERAVREARLLTFSTIAFSTHSIALTDGAGIYEPGLVLTPPRISNATTDDGFLRRL